MEKHQNRNNDGCVNSRSFNILLKPGSIFIELHRRTRDVRVHRSEFPDKLLLLISLPNILLGINLQQEFARATDKEITQESGHVLRLQPLTVVLLSNEGDGFVQTAKQRLLESGEFAGR